ncbi:transposase [Desulfonema ishimotonii]|uniref:Transposase n=1 Tax=Desulfonema ishimotonii TaxID=45657 RepID=A0A401FVZ2_9BACT|nr:helix-turn-helix domain-containing protein [Desulfonema ishimotonii]GBC61131.1 transposase [Desulfonema ishimotonii]
MPKGKKYNISLTDDEREFLKKYIRTGKHTARNITRARILLLSSEGKTNAEIVKSLGICPATVSNIRKRFTESGLFFALGGKPFPGQPAKPDGKGQATLIALACSDPPEGHSSWTMQLLADKLAEPDTVKSISDKTVRKY